MMGIIFFVTVPETIIRSLWRGDGTHDLHAEAGNVITAGCSADHFDGAARQSKHQRPNGSAAAPVVNFVKAGNSYLCMQVLEEFHNQENSIRSIPCRLSFDENMLVQSGRIIAER